MQHQNPFSVAIHRYAQAKSVANDLKSAIESLKTQGELVGLTVEEFPAETDKSLLGFDLAFTDRRIRLVVTGSAMHRGHVAIECWCVPMLQGANLDKLLTFEVAKNGEFKLPPGTDSLWIESMNGAFSLVCHLVELVNAPRAK